MEFGDLLRLLRRLLRINILSLLRVVIYRVEGSLLLVHYRRLSRKVLQIPQLLRVGRRRLERDRARRGVRRWHLVACVYHVARWQVGQRRTVYPRFRELLGAIEIHQLFEVQLARNYHGLTLFVEFGLVYYHFVLHIRNLLIVVLPIFDRRVLGQGTVGVGLQKGLELLLGGVVLH